MKKFIIRFLLFLIPFYFVGILILGVYHAGYETGEFCDFDELIQEQRKIILYLLEWGITRILLIISIQT